MKYPDHLLKLIAVLKRLPGVGSRSAERFAFHLLNWPNKDLLEMGQVIRDIQEKLQKCNDCGCLKDDECCSFCDISKRDYQKICLIASAKDAYLIEETGEYRGLYHVLGHLLSPIHGRLVDVALVEKIKQRIQHNHIQEVIIALDSTLEGDATALFLKKELEALDIQTSRLALGLPMGSSLDFIDGGTLARALAGRRSY